MDMREKFEMFWATRRPEHKNYLKIATAGLVVVVIAWGASTAVRGNKPAPKDISNSETILLGNPAALSAQDQAKKLDSLTREVAKIQDLVTNSSQLTKQQIQDINTESQTAAEKAGQVNGAEKGPGSGMPPQEQAQIDALQSQVAALQASANKPRDILPTPVIVPDQVNAGDQRAAGIVEINGNQPASPPNSSAGTSYDNGVPPPPATPNGVSRNVSVPGGHADNNNGNGREAVAQTTSGNIHGLVENGTNGAGDAVKVNSADEAYLPPGTIITGVTLNGVNVGTTQSAMANPQIVEIRIKKSAIMPNGYRINLENCMIIATGSGNLGAERIYLRPTTMSCVGPGGTAIESAVKGYVVGDDGITGMRGIVISHQGELIEKGLFAGMLSGLGSSFAPQPVTPLSINPGTVTQYQYPSASSVVGNSIGSGINNAGSMVANFYIQQATQLQPTLQANPGVSVDVILEQGATVKKKGMTKSQIAREAWTAQESSQGPSSHTQSPQDRAASSIAAGVTANTGTQMQQQRQQPAIQTAPQLVN